MTWEQRLTQWLFRRRDGILRSGWRLLLFAVAVLAIGGTAMLATSMMARVMRLAGGPFAGWELFASGTSGVLVTLAATAIMLRAAERRKLPTVGLPLRGRWLVGGIVGVVLGFAPVALTVAASLGFGYGQISGGAVGSTDGPLALPAKAVGLALVSTSEELLARGYVLQVLAQGLGRWPAALLTSLLWTSQHAGNDGASALALAPTFLSGVLLAWIVMRSGSLWLAIGYHVAWNFTSATLFGMVTSGEHLTPSLWRVALTGPWAVAGGSYGFEGSLVTGVLDTGLLALALALIRRLPSHPEALRHYRRPR